MSDSKTTPTEVGERLRWAREQAGLSQGQVAKMLGYHRPTVSQIEGGQRRITPGEIHALSVLYQVDESWIVSGATTDSLKNSRIAIAARELDKLRKEDFDVIMQLIRAMRQADGDENE